MLTASLIFSCGEKSDEKKETKDNTEESANEETAEESAAEEIVECEAPMMDFLGMLKGKYTDVEAALDKFQAEDLDRADMDMYDLQEPKVVACSKSETGECCTMEAKAGMTIRTYDICWENDKITSIIDKGMR